ncbi:unnamed protein product [Sphagnum troendelagicum]|uniref:Uncharacterized protein n=1 Tax=Sphagnum troendelagicum TaxID=128251 RepID=A0ABP0TX98_9BRYO
MSVVAMQATVAPVAPVLGEGFVQETSQQADQNGMPTVAAIANAEPHATVIGDLTPGVVATVTRSVYPLALAKHEEVVASKELFLDTLNKFHTALGTRLAIPKIAGKDLDLHLLYIEVTSRGGLQQVIKDRKWKELTFAFNFPNTATSAAYILRKYYIGLLHHYEQVYYFRAEGPLVPPPMVGLPVSLPGPRPTSVERGPTGYSVSEAVPDRRIVDPALSIGNVVPGAIEGKFELGYLVSITMGTEKLRGVLYHVAPAHRGLQHASVLNYSGTLGAEPKNPNGEEASDWVSIRKRKRKRKGKDPNAPRANRSGYNFFFGEQRMRLKTLYPDKDKELSCMIGDAWNKLTEEEKMPYQEQGVKDKERYLKEIREYKELLKLHDGVIPAEIPMLQKKTKKNIKEENP